MQFGVEKNKTKFYTESKLKKKVKRGSYQYFYWKT